MKIAISGAPYSGKTTTLTALEKKTELPIIHESALFLIEHLEELIGFENSKLWRTGFNTAWQNLVAYSQLDAEQQNGEDFIVDSTPIDCLAFAYAYETEITQPLLDSCKKVHYDYVFFLEMIKPFDPRLGTGRLQTLEDCENIGAYQFQTYQAYGMEPIRIPFMPVEKRVEKILQLSHLATREK